MLSKTSSELSLQDLEALLDNVAESRRLDYKQKLVVDSDSDRKEFLADVTAFANAGGGDIIFGIAEVDGVASKIIGIHVQSRDVEERRLGDLIRSGTEPRVTGFEFRWIDFENDLVLLVLRIARSWASPHRVILRGHDKFYMRNAAGKHPMNTEELRSAFLRGETFADRIRSFRRDRIGLLQTDEAPLPITQGPIAVLHLVPLISIADPPLLKFEDYEATPRQIEGGSGTSYLETLDGKVAFSRPEPVSSYTLQFRNGMIEAVLCPGVRTQAGVTEVAVGYLEQCMVDYLPFFFSYLKKKEIREPYYLLLSLLNVQNTVFPTDRARGLNLAVQRRNTLLFPELIIDSVDQQPMTNRLKPLCDLLWNAFGYPRSWNFSLDGSWQPRVS